MLSTLDKVKKLIMIPGSDTSMDDLLSLQMTAASQEIEKYCKRSFRKDLYTEIHSGNSQYLTLRNYPVLSITEINDGSGPIDGYKMLDDGMVYREGKWTPGQHNITVTYEAGYVLPGEETAENPRTLPETIELACMMLTKMLFDGQFSKESERLGDYSVKYVVSNSEQHKLPPPIMALINPYVGRWV